MSVTSLSVLLARRHSASNAASKFCNARSGGRPAAAQSDQPFAAARCGLSSSMRAIAALERGCALGCGKVATGCDHVRRRSPDGFTACGRRWPPRRLVTTLGCDVPDGEMQLVISRGTRDANEGTHHVRFRAYAQSLGVSKGPGRTPSKRKGGRSGGFLPGSAAPDRRSACAWAAMRLSTASLCRARSRRRFLL
jgi:hypothetical protein